MNYFVLIEPDLEQKFLAFFSLHAYKSVEQRILLMSLVYVGIVEQLNCCSMAS